MLYIGRPITLAGVTVEGRPVVEHPEVGHVAIPLGGCVNEFLRPMCRCNHGIDKSAAGSSTAKAQITINVVWRLDRPTWIWLSPAPVVHSSVCPGALSPLFHSRPKEAVFISALPVSHTRCRVAMCLQRLCSTRHWSARLLSSRHRLATRWHPGDTGRIHGAYEPSPTPTCALSSAKPSKQCNLSNIHAAIYRLNTLISTILPTYTGVLYRTTFVQWPDGPIVTAMHRTAQGWDAPIASALPTLP